MTDDHSASRRADVLREEAPHLIADETSMDYGRALTLAVDALDFRSEWLGDYAEREYGEEQAAQMIAEVAAAWRFLQRPNVLTIRVDVSGLDNARQLDALIGEMCAQAEPSDDHPGAEILDADGPDLPRTGRTVLVHVNLTIPPDSPATADDLAEEIRAALEIAAEDPSANAPGLATADLVEIPLAEEVD